MHFTIQPKEMKQFYAILFSALFCSAAKSQVVLNEIYADPSAGSHEFFELYNTNYFGLPVTLDDYTVLSYFEEGKTKGFYVLDLPNLSLAPKGYFVGSAALPFNYQGNTGSTASDFSWNDPLLAANYGYIRKWVATGNTAADGNRNYDEVPLPVGFNDLFPRITGNSASYNAFVYKNGKLVNSFIGGTGGGTSLPASIASMPVFKLESVTQLGNKTYTIAWNAVKNENPEFVIPDIGTDNGFIRLNDGMCGTWDKSSSQAFHTPKRTNGGSQMAVVGLLTLESHIYPGTNASDPSFVVYNITAGPADLFPVELHVYADNGSVEGELDANDVFIEVNIENEVKDGPFTTYFTPSHQDILIVAQTTVGCWDQIRYVPNKEIMLTPLAVQLKMFTGKYADSKSFLEWIVSANETGSYFEVEKSTDGKVFRKEGMVYNTSKAGEEYYTFSAGLSTNSFYRLKMVNKDKSIHYSPLVLVKAGTVGGARLQVLQNPVMQTLMFTLPATETETVTATIYNAVGAKLSTTRLTTYPGANTYQIDLTPQMATGTYLLEVSSKTTKHIERFIKR
jgi:hypothetical protein